MMEMCICWERFDNSYQGGSKKNDWCNLFFHRCGLKATWRDSRCQFAGLLDKYLYKIGRKGKGHSIL